MKLKSIERIDPVPSRCIEVDSPDRLFYSGGETGDKFLSHNSVAQNIVFLGCALRPDKWQFIGIDLKRVEFSHLRKYRDVVLGIAVTSEQALQALRYAQNVMMKRYAYMEQEEAKKFLGMKGNENAKSLMVMIDEATELFNSSGDDKDEILKLVGSIARLGRAASVHLLVATQKPKADVIPTEIRDNLTTRAVCGRAEAGISRVVLDGLQATRTRSNPPGGMYFQALGKGDYIQGFFASESWLDDWLEKNNKTLDSEGDRQAELELAEDEGNSGSERPEETWDDDMEEISQANG